MKIRHYLAVFFCIVLISWATYSPANDPNNLDHKRPFVARVIKFARWAGILFLFGDQPPEESIESVEPVELIDGPLYGAAAPAGALDEPSDLLDHSAGW